MILIIDISYERNSLYFEEFVRPILQIITESGFSYKTSYYKDVSEQLLNEVDKVIICGTGLKDNEYLKNLDKFSWIPQYSKPLFGICAGGQVIAALEGGNIGEEKEIGIYVPTIKKNDFILENVRLKQIYCLHKRNFSIPPGFEELISTEMSQLVKKNRKYACLFHPEVRNEGIIRNFLSL